MKRFLAWLGFRVNKSCSHERPVEFKDRQVTQRVIGVTLDWAGYPTPLYQWSGPCAKCGEEYSTQGILPRRFDFVNRNSNGWPVDQNGNEYPIYVQT